MNYKERMKYNKLIYQNLKSAVKSRKLKLSAEQFVYKKVSPYFYSMFYNLKSIEDNKAIFSLEITIKYHRFDELQYSIIDPDYDFKFTDKIRANSIAKCNAALPRFEQTFDFDSKEESIPNLCEHLLDFFENYCHDFLTMINKEYGDLNGYYTSKEEQYPRLAGLAYLDQGDKVNAARCFSSNKMDGEEDIWSKDIQTLQQRQRAIESGKKIYNYQGKESIEITMKEKFANYAIALIKNLDWDADKASYGLLSSEQ